MSYALYLAIFLLAPICLLAGLLAFTARPRRLPGTRRGPSPVMLVLALALLALAYTAVWDDHLIAIGVWTYAPRLISGLLVGHVPLEELAFMALEPVLVGLWVLWLAQRRLLTPVVRPARTRALRIGSALATGVVWAVGLALLASAWPPGTYLGWELAWGLPPLALQMLVAADVFWQQRRRLAYAVLVPWLYLSASDALAIHVGIWTINPHLSLGIRLGGGLPLEELVFFLLTTLLVSGGLVAGMALAAPGWRPGVHSAPLGMRAPAGR